VTETASSARRKSTKSDVLPFGSGAKNEEKKLQ
jgi:hypothetical protein